MSVYLVLAIPLAVALFMLWPRVTGVASTLSAVGFAGAIAALIPQISALVSSGEGAFVEGPILWEAGRLKVPLDLVLDSTALLMCTIVLAVAIPVVLFSHSYIDRTHERRRYFALLNVFVVAMLLLVMADNVIVLLFAWECVGLTSYLLIGFWYRETPNAVAATQAFVLNKLGDAGLLMAAGSLLVYSFHSENPGLSIRDLALQWRSSDISPHVAGAVGVGLVWAACAKSAQVPMHFWLPNAMVGPTPVSALIHAATMVAAGVYLLVRFDFVMQASDTARTWALVAGSITALLGAIAALAQQQLKRLLAYSTISQLGLMFMAIGAASPQAALGHLATHAGFKALLFLVAGVLLAHGGKEIRTLASKKPHRFIQAAFFAGALALSGAPIFFLSPGFASKESILHSLLELHTPLGLAATAVFFCVSALTAAYVWKCYSTIYPSQHVPVGNDAGHPTPLQSFSLVWLLMAAVVAGAAAAWLGTFDAVLTLTSAVVAGGGFVAGRYLANRKDEAAGRLYAWAQRGFDTEAVVYACVVRPIHALARAANRLDAFIDSAVVGACGLVRAIAQGAAAFDHIAIDGCVRGLSLATQRGSLLLRRAHTGAIQAYLAVALVGAFVATLFALGIAG